MSSTPCIEMRDASMSEDSSSAANVDVYYAQYHNDKMDPYRILGVPPNASLADIKLAYRRLALGCHPDKVSSSDDWAAKARAHDEFARLSAAYEILTTKSSSNDENWSASTTATTTTPAVLYGPIATDPRELYRHTFSAQPPPTSIIVAHAPLFNSWTGVRNDENQISPSPNGTIIAGYLTNEPANTLLYPPVSSATEPSSCKKRSRDDDDNDAHPPAPNNNNNKRQRVRLQAAQVQAHPPPLQKPQLTNSQWMMMRHPTTTYKRDASELMATTTQGGGEFDLFEPSFKRARRAAVCA